MPIDTADIAASFTSFPGEDRSNPLLSASGKWSGAKGTDGSFHDQVRQLRDASFVSFARVEDRVSIWIADDRGMQFHAASPGLDEILRLTNEVLDLAVDPFCGDCRMKSTGTRLYKALFGPIHDKLVPERLLYVHLGSELRHLPVSLLRLPGGEYLVDTFRVLLAADFPSQRRHRHADRFTAQSRFLTVVGPGCGGGSRDVDDAPDAQRESAERVEFLPSHLRHHSILASGAATRASFLRLAAQAHGIHCRVVVSDGVHGPQLHLSGEPAEQKTGERRGVDSLPLASLPSRSFAQCRVGVFETSPVSRRLEEQHLLWRRLVSGLHQLGMSQVIVPRWNVGPSVMKTFSEVFYESLLGGVPVEDAFRDGIKRIRSREDWSHPHFWAGFAHSVSHL